MVFLMGSDITIAELRVVLRALAILERHGLAEVSIAEAVAAARAAVIRRCGLRRYVSDLLTGKAGWPVERFELRRGSAQIDVDAAWQGCRLVDFLEHLPEEERPDRAIYVEQADGEKRITLYF